MSGAASDGPLGVGAAGGGPAARGSGRERVTARRADAQRRRRLSQRWFGVGYVAVGLAIASALAWPIYASPRFVVVAVVGSMLGIAVPLVVAWRRWAPWTGLPLAIGAYLVAVVPLAIPSALSSVPAAIVGLRDGLLAPVLGWKQLVTLELPLGEYQAVLAPFLVLVIAVGAGATALATAPGRLPVLAVPLVLLAGVFGIAFGSTEGGAPLVLGGLQLGAASQVLFGALLAAISLAWLVIRTRLARRTALREARADAGVVGGSRPPLGPVIRRRAIAAGLVVLALVGGVLVTPALSGASARSTLRTGIEPQLVVRAQPTPLTTYRTFFDSSRFDEPLFRVSGGAGVDRLRLASLDEWDGQRFTVGDDAARFTRLPGGTAPAGSTSLTVTALKGMSGIWMPLPDGVTSAPSFGGARSAALADGFYLDRATGAGIDIAPTSDGARGLAARDSYTVRVPASTAPQLGAPGASSLIDLQQYPQLQGWLKAQGQPRSAAGLTTLLERLRARGYLSHGVADDGTSKDWIQALTDTGPYQFQASYAGQSRGRIEALFQQLLDRQNVAGAKADEARLVAGIGDDEQFATAAALIARALGYDSRVVVGVRLVPLKGSGVAACSGACRGGELAAWTEVRSPDSEDWTALDAEPQFTLAPTLVRIGQQLPKNPTIPDQPKSETAQPPTVQRNDDTTSVPPSDDGNAWWRALLPVLRVIGLALSGIVLLLLPLLVLIVAKGVRRRRRRRAPVPEVAVVGAWAETVDAWVDARRTPVGATRRDQAASIGSAEAAELATLVDAAVFSAHPPTRDAAAEAWRRADAEAVRLRSESTLGERIRSLVSPRSFLRAVDLRSVIPSPALVRTHAARTLLRRKDA